MTERVDVIVIGGGAAGLMSAIAAGQRGRRVRPAQQSVRPAAALRTVLAEVLPRSFAQRLCDVWLDSRPMRRFNEPELRRVAARLASWPLAASGTEGYRTAEVTLGGVDTDELSSTTMESRLVPNLYFIGEVVDVTDWLGGYNFQWAWASGRAAGLAVSRRTAA